MEKPKEKKARCNYKDCRKKLGLIKFTCRCEKDFCITHKLPESHQCTFNYLCKSKMVLKDKLVKVVNDKIIRI